MQAKTRPLKAIPKSGYFLVTHPLGTGVKLECRLDKRHVVHFQFLVRHRRGQAAQGFQAQALDLTALLNFARGPVRSPGNV